MFLTLAPVCNVSQKSEDVFASGHLSDSWGTGRRRLGGLRHRSRQQRAAECIYLGVLGDTSDISKHLLTPLDTSWHLLTNVPSLYFVLWKRAGALVAVQSTGSLLFRERIDICRSLYSPRDVLDTAPGAFHLLETLGSLCCTRSRRWSDVRIYSPRLGLEQLETNASVRLWLLNRTPELVSRAEEARVINVWFPKKILWPGACVSAALSRRHQRRATAQALRSSNWTLSYFNWGAYVCVLNVSLLCRISTIDSISPKHKIKSCFSPPELNHWRFLGCTSKLDIVGPSSNSNSFKSCHSNIKEIFVDGCPTLQLSSSGGLNLQQNLARSLTPALTCFLWNVSFGQKCDVDTQWYTFISCIGSDE